ncbi:MAG: aminoacetone oxidase family FAD-binding enzyme, partial [Lachnospiraceae bacterium]
ITPALPSLVPLLIREQSIAADLMGLSLKNVSISIREGNKEHYSDFGELLFTHFGLSGPVILSASAVVGPLLKKKELALFIDLKPALSGEQLDQRLLRDFSDLQNRALKNALSGLFPSRLISEVIRQSGVSPERRIHDLTREERAALVGATKGLHYTLTGLRGFNEAIITKGGVSVKEVNPSTMESKRISGLYFAGELLDLDALTGGFNLQIAWSTGWLAGKSAAEER